MNLCATSRMDIHTYITVGDLVFFCVLFDCRSFARLREPGKERHTLSVLPVGRMLLAARFTLRRVRSLPRQFVRVDSAGPQSRRVGCLQAKVVLFSTTSRIPFKDRLLHPVSAFVTTVGAGLAGATLWFHSNKPIFASSAKQISLEELAKHNTAESCWVAINGVVYDVTEFLNHHPGGPGPLLAAGGTVATTKFEAFHRDNILPAGGARFKVGLLKAQPDDGISGAIDLSSNDAKNSGKHRVTRCTPPELRGLVSVADMQQEAARRGAPSLLFSVNYGAEDEESIENNRAGFNRYRLRPRVCRDVSSVSTKISILSGRINLDFPVLIAPFAGARAMHPDGERCLAAAATKNGVACVVPHYGGFPLPEVSEAAQVGERQEENAGGPRQIG